jgi:hypothetical protein
MTAADTHAQATSTVGGARLNKVNKGSDCQESSIASLPQSIIKCVLRAWVSNFSKLILANLGVSRAATDTIRKEYPCLIASLV